METPSELDLKINLARKQAKFKHDKKYSRFRTTKGTVRINEDETGYETQEAKGLNRHTMRRLARQNRKLLKKLKKTNKKPQIDENID